MSLKSTTPSADSAGIMLEEAISPYLSFVTLISVTVENQ